MYTNSPHNDGSVKDQVTPLANQTTINWSDQKLRDTALNFSESYMSLGQRRKQSNDLQTQLEPGPGAKGEPELEVYQAQPSVKSRKSRKYCNQFFVKETSVPSPQGSSPEVVEILRLQSCDSVNEGQVSQSKEESQARVGRDAERSNQVQLQLERQSSGTNSQLIFLDKRLSQINSFISISENQVYSSKYECAIQGMKCVWSMQLEKANHIFSAYEAQDFNFELFKLEIVIQEILVSGTQQLIERGLLAYDAALNKLLKLQKLKGKAKNAKELAPVQEFDN